MAELDFVHRHVAARVPDKAPLLLLHGTGGNEDDLLPLGEALSPGAALLSPRGKVVERGMPRFFRRVAEGVFDVEDLERRTDELAGFVAAARKAYGLAKPVAVGFSNGANIAWSLLFRHPDALAGAVLMRPMLPHNVPPRAELSAIPVLILSGAQDPLCTPAQRDRLAETLRAAGADLTYEVLPASHGLTQQDVDTARHWFARL